jgi:UDP-GlcNAc:undecaprenyl-phosphate GlcNAc-1-phosphate transferase
MTTILFSFVVALIISLVVTPVAGRLGVRLGAIDEVNDRKMHTSPVPRAGGVAIVFAFLFSIIITTLLHTDVSKQLEFDQQILFFFLGGLLTVGIGIFDDFKRLGHKVKFLFQILGASVAYAGGVRIDIFPVLGFELHISFICYLITVFWFLFFINAINLIDGLDGLAGGICFFTIFVMGLLSLLKGSLLQALYFAALAGSLLGFLRYNFNPASIFMGDGGSYFLGYTIAGLSILGSMKSSLSAAILIPIVALGVPVLDTIISPVRRFILGRRMFKADNGHIHHQLVSLGFSKKKAVLIIYGISISLCVLSVCLVNFRDEQSGLLLVILAAIALVFIRKIGYFDYVTNDKLLGWFKDISDEAGFSRDRRSFLELQLEIGRSKDTTQLWNNMCAAFDKLEFDMAELLLNSPGDGRQSKQVDEHSRPQYHFEWRKNNFKQNDHLKDSLLKMELPLNTSNGNRSYGTLFLIKDLKRDPMSHYTLRRVEHLRRSTIGKLKHI